MLTATERQQKARIAALSRHRRTDPATIELARSFKAARLEDYIKRTVDEAPPLTAEQRQHLASILAGSADAA